jgi:hypothetical protein
LHLRGGMHDRCQTRSWQLMRVPDRTRRRRLIHNINLTGGLIVCRMNGLPLLTHLPIGFPSILGISRILSNVESL